MQLYTLEKVCRYCIEKPCQSAYYKAGVVECTNFVVNTPNPNFGKKRQRDGQEAKEKKKKRIDDTRT